MIISRSSYNNMKMVGKMRECVCVFVCVCHTLVDGAGVLQVDGVMLLT